MSVRRRAPLLLRRPRGFARVHAEALPMATNLATISAGCAVGGRCWFTGVDPFSRSWTALHAAVAETRPTGNDPLDALIVRLAAAYEEPRLPKLHFDNVGSAAGRAAELSDPGLWVSTQDQVLTAGDYLCAYVLEWTLHHLDPIAHLPRRTLPRRGLPGHARCWRRSPGQRARGIF